MESKPKMSAGSEVLLTLACLNSAQLSLRWKTQQKNGHCFTPTDLRVS